MVKEYIFIKDKHTPIRQAFTFLETLLVLAIVMCLLLCTHISYQNIHGSSKISLYQIQTLIEQARIEAMQSHTKVEIAFENDRICTMGQCYFDDKDIWIENEITFSFNENGNIDHGGHVDIHLDGKSYRLIFNVGRGAYRIEKNSICATRCLICFSYLFKCCGVNLFKPCIATT